MASPARRQARITALQTLYELDSTAHPPSEVLTRNLTEPVSENNSANPMEPGGREFARSLVVGVLAHREKLDEIIIKSAPNWPLDQMSPVDKNILRLAIFEILFDNKVPLKAAINEAVELGKRFGSDSSSRFINGVLGTVAAEETSHGRKAPGKGSRAEELPD
ncbi:MAG: transcription antitermination factor NusB [Chloroflexi bacterium]|nr:transcription antitermination factor NusB [Chloroflexota bacterium]